MNWDVNPESWVVLTSPHLDSAHPGNSRSGAVPASSFGSYRQRDRNLYKMHPTMEKCDQLFLAACTTYNIYIYSVYSIPSTIHRKRTKDRSCNSKPHNHSKGVAPCRHLESATSDWQIQLPHIQLVQVLRRVCLQVLLCEGLELWEPEEALNTWHVGIWVVTWRPPFCSPSQFVGNAKSFILEFLRILLGRL